MYHEGTRNAGFGPRQQVRARNSRSKSLDDLFYYFFHLDKNDASPEVFQDYWENLPDYDLNPKQLSNILYRSAKYIRDGLSGPEGYYQHKKASQLRAIIIENWRLWEDMAIDKMEKTDSFAMRMVLYAHRFLRFKPTPRLAEAFTGINPRAAASFDLTDMHLYFNESAQLGINVSGAITRNLYERLKRGETFDGKGQNTDLIWSLAVIDSIFPRGEYKQIADMLRPRLSDTRSHNTLHKKRFDAATWFGWDLANFYKPKRGETKSYFERRLRKHFESAGIRTTKMTDPSAIPDFPQAVDFSIHRNNRLLHIEVDGPTHLLTSLEKCAHQNDRYNPPYDGPTLFRSSNLHNAAKEDTILRLPFPVADLMIGDNADRMHKLTLSEREKISRDFVALALGQPPGVYRANIYEGSSEDRRTLQVVSILPDQVNGMHVING